MPDPSKDGARPPEEDLSDGKKTDEPEKEQIFEVLSNQRRRYTLSYLEQHENGEVDVGTLVTEVAAMENEVPPKQVKSDQRKSVYVGLRQSHLPKMDEYNLVKYDKDRGTVALTENANQAKMYLEFVPENDIPWAYHYVGISLIMAVITVLAWQNVFPFSELGGLTVAVLTIAVVGLSGIVHSIYTRRNRLDQWTDSDHWG